MTPVGQLARSLAKILQAGFGLPDVVGMVEEAHVAKSAIAEMRGLPSDELSVVIDQYLRAYLRAGRGEIAMRNEYEAVTLDIAQILSSERVVEATTREVILHPEGLNDYLRKRPEVVSLRAGLREDVEPYLDSVLHTAAEVITRLAPTNTSVQLSGFRMTLEQLRLVTDQIADASLITTQTDERVRRLQLEMRAGFQELADLQTNTNSLGQHLWLAQELRHDRTSFFVGRSYIFDDIADRLRNAKSGYIILRGQPGVGKSAVMSELVRRQRCVFHFNVAASGITSAQKCLFNLCAQLILRYELPHHSIPADAGLDASWLSRLLTEAAAAARRDGILPILVVVDALDEADDPVGSQNRLKLPGELPDGVFIVASIRDNVEDGLHVQRRLPPIALRTSDKRNLEDVRTFVDSSVSLSHDLGSRVQAWANDRTDFTELIVSHSEGNFMYVVHVLRSIANGSLTPQSHGGTLPSGLTDYYRRHWRAMRSRDAEWFESAQRPVICTLAVAPYPLNVDEVLFRINESRQFAPVTEREVLRVLAEWRQFMVNESLDPPTWRLYHKSFVDFLGSSDADGVDLMSFRRASVAALRSKVQWGVQADSGQAIGGAEKQERP